MDIKPLNRVPETKALIGCGTTKLYELISAGQLDARKAGTRTLITGESIKRYVESLPRAHVVTGRSQQSPDIDEGVQSPPPGLAAAQQASLLARRGRSRRSDLTG